MGLFERLFGRAAARSSRPGVGRHGTGATGVHLCDGQAELKVVGESHYQENLLAVIGHPDLASERVRVDMSAVLMPEVDNPHDANAISVDVNGLKVGYLSREDARQYRPGLLALQKRVGKPIALAGVIVGGGMREDGVGQLGVFLRHDPHDFGLGAAAAPPATGAGMRTGLTDAIATDRADDSYDLAWISDVPEEPVRAIPVLRGLLGHEKDPIDRHFIFHHLEKALYASRDAFPSALDEYDRFCVQHDFEMDVIRAAFIAKWGRIPWLETYRQMCIRLAKAERFDEALRWAERGITIYGANAARPDAVQDLLKRAEKYRAKLGRVTQ